MKLLPNKVKNYFRNKFGNTIIRSWEAAKSNRFLSDWLTETASINSDIKSGLPTLRARTRNMVQNCPFFNKYLALREKNIFGADGIRLQMKIRDANGTLDKAANREIEAAWKEWSSSKNCTVTRNKSILDVEKLVDATRETDGEFFIRKVRGFDNDFGFALQIINPQKCDLEKNITAMGNKNQVIMGVKIDSWGAPLSYLFNSNNDTVTYNYQHAKTIEYKVGQIIHGFVEKFPGQVRGYPQAASILFNLQMIKGYSEAEVMASRASACKMGIYTTPKGDSIKGMADEKSGNQFQVNVEPLTFQHFPEGTDFKTFDTQNPNANYSKFMQAQLREIASGLDISYNFLHSNMESVNFSSLRAAALEERDRWRIEQAWYIEHLLQPVFDEWLDLYLLSSKTNLPYSKKWKFQAATWMPRAYQWVDPRKDAQANILMKDELIISPQDLIAERGKDPEDVIAEIKEWNVLTEGMRQANEETTKKETNDEK